MNTTSRNESNSLINLLSFTLVGLLLSGCATTSTNGLSSEINNYFENKAISALSDKNGIRKLEGGSGGSTGGNLVLIEIRPTQEDSEKRCLKVIRALSRDPQFPSSISEIFVFVKYEPPKQNDKFCYRITRDALLKGAVPKAIYRNGVAVSGERTPSTNSVWSGPVYLNPGVNPNNATTSDFHR